jgi:adenosylhomocysteine nucleosidase
LFAFVASEAREFSGLLCHVEGLTTLDLGIDFTRGGVLNGRSIVMAANGPGQKLAGQAADAIQEHCNLEGLVSIGFCGALNPSLQPCDIVLAGTIVAEAGVARAVSMPRSHSCERDPVKLWSSDHVASTAQEKSSLHVRHSADAIDMEAAALAVRAEKWQIPFYAIKVVTDTASESFPLDFNRLRTPEGRFSYSKIIAATLIRPRAIPALIHLNRRCTQASQILGDFLADASF